MPMPLGHKHSAETRRKMSKARLGKPHSAAHNAAIAAGNRGKIMAKRYTSMCNCGTKFKSGARNVKFCSLICRRASYGHGLVNAPAYAAFPKRCAICANPNQLVGDHDHLTEKPRGILCRNCNLAIGNMFDDPQRLRKAANYLENK
jgi:Recombination endonuclease VII/NUMOD3 motif